MNLRFLRRPRAIGLDIGSGSVKALRLERHRGEVTVTGRAMRPVEATADPRQVAQAITPPLPPRAPTATLSWPRWAGRTW